MRVTLVTTWQIACGIAEHAFYLKEAIEQADPSIQIEVETDLHPDAVLTRPGARTCDWVWLNYHAALHSQWTPEHVRAVQAVKVGTKTKVGITYHDTGVPNSAQCKALHAVADCFVIHEPAEDLPGAVYLRQGIPAPAPAPWYATKGDGRSLHRWFRPTVGTIGFPFGWKNYDLLAEASALAGWGLLLLAPNCTVEQQLRWHALNPDCRVISEFTQRDEALALLSGCDATAFLYANANTGTSAAIRLGVAARKPVLATSEGICRQFRDLYQDPVGACAITWIHGVLDVETVAGQLAWVESCNHRVVRLAHQDSWASVGQRYACLLRGMKP